MHTQSQSYNFVTFGNQIFPAVCQDPHFIYGQDIPVPNTCPLWRALAVIGVDTIYTGSSVGTLMTGAIVNVVLTVCPIEAWYE